MKNHTGCICLTFLHCAFSNVLSNCLLERMQSHTGCICLTFLHCAFSNVPSKRLHKRIHNHTGCICSTFLHYASSNVLSNCLLERIHNHTGCICLIFPSALGQLFHWNFSAWNYHAQCFVPSPTSGKVCLLMLSVLNWRKFRCEIATKKKKMKVKSIHNTIGICNVWEGFTGNLKDIRHLPKLERHLPDGNRESFLYLYAIEIIS